MTSPQLSNFQTPSLPLSPQLGPVKSENDPKLVFFVPSFLLPPPLECSYFINRPLVQNQIKYPLCYYTVKMGPHWARIWYLKDAAILLTRCYASRYIWGLSNEILSKVSLRSNNCNLVLINQESVPVKEKKIGSQTLTFDSFVVFHNTKSRSLQNFNVILSLLEINPFSLCLCSFEVDFWFWDSRFRYLSIKNSFLISFFVLNDNIQSSLNIKFTFSIIVPKKLICQCESLRW